MQIPSYSHFRYFDSRPSLSHCSATSLLLSSTLAQRKCGVIRSALFKLVVILAHLKHLGFSKCLLPNRRRYYFKQYGCFTTIRRRCKLGGNFCRILIELPSNRCFFLLFRVMLMILSLYPPLSELK